MAEAPGVGSFPTSGPGSSGFFSLRSWVMDRFRPVVMVLSTDEVERICKDKNGLDLVDILRPFGDLPNVNYPLRIGERSIRVKDLKLRFHYASTIDQPTAEVLDNHLKNVVSSTVDEELEGLPNTLEACKKSSSYGTLSPWFEKYRDEFLRLLCFDSHETFDHPVACIFAISSSDAAPLEALEQLKKEHAWPPLMTQDYMFRVQEEDFAKFVLVVHDGSSGDKSLIDAANATVREIQRRYDNNCVLLVINTAAGNKELQGCPPQPYKRLRKASIPGGGAGEVETPCSLSTEELGKCISNGDLDRIRMVIETFASISLLPKLDIRISKLSSVLPLKRRSFAKFMDRTSTYLKMNFTGVPRDHATAIGFKYYTPEAQARQMGDILFLLHRYEEAIDAYSSVSVSKEQFPKFFAGLQEMIGLCHSMISSLGNPAQCFSRAFECYQRVPGKTSRMLATRCSIMHASYLSSANQLLPASQILMQAYEGEEMLRGALLLEQAAFMLLSCDPPLTRKFAFQMTLAGVWYYNSMLKDLSMRCYTLVVGVYKGRQWQAVEEHIGDMMLRFALEQGQFEAAMGWTQQMLSPNNCLPLKTQSHYLKSLSDYVLSLDKDSKSSMVGLDIPVCSEVINVDASSEYVVGSSEAGKAPSNVWKQLEKCFKDRSSSNSALNGGGGQAAPSENHRLVSCGEEIGIVCQFQNPLKLQIDVCEVKLCYEYEWAEGASGANPVTVMEERFTLKGDQTVIVRLGITVNAPGVLKVTGVRWKLNEVIPGEMLFNTPKASSLNRLPLRAKSNNPCLFFMAVSPLPRLEATNAPRPDEMFVGEVYEGCWELRNQGQVGLINLQVAVSLPDAVFAMVQDKKNSGDNLNKVIEAASGPAHEVYVLTTQEEIAGGVSVKCPVCIHPAVSGNHIFHCLFRYESVEATGSIGLRYLKYSFAMKVHDALKIRHSLRAPDLNRVASLLKLDIVNKLPNQDIHIQSAAAICGQWNILMVGCEDAAKTGNTAKIGQLVPPKKKAHAFLLVDSKKPVDQCYGYDQSTTEMSALELLQKRRIVSSVQCSTSATDSLCVSVKWSTPCASERRSSDSQVAYRWGFIYCYQSPQTIFRPIHLSIAGSLTIHHKFHGNPVCSVPILVSVSNTSAFSASVSIEAGSRSRGDRECSWNASTSTDEQETFPNRISHVAAGHSPVQSTAWCLQTRKSIPVLEPGGHVSVPMVLAVFRPGQYCVTDYLCSWTIETSPAEHGVTDGPPIILSVMEE